MSDAEFSPWCALLAAIIERAQADAAGRTLGEARHSRAHVQWEARRWLRDELAGWREFAAPGAPYRRRPGAQRLR